MNAFVAKDSPQPLYLQQKDFILQHLRERRYRPGDLLPSENDICAISEVSIRTVRRALAELEKDGVLVRLRGRGTFLKQLAPSLPSSPGIIGIMFSDMHFVTRPTFSTLLSAMESRIHSAGYHCHLYATGQRDTGCPAPLAELLPNDRPAGLIATSALNPDDLAWLKQQKIPFCAFNEYRRFQVNQVRFDFAQAAKIGMRHLHDLKCRCIACFCEHLDTASRTAVYGNELFRASALATARALSPHLSVTFYKTEATIEAGARMAATLWNAPMPPDAFFTTDPLPALGIQTAALLKKKSGVNILTCYGLPDHPEIPSLTAPLEKMGREAVDTLIHTIKYDSAKIRQKIFAPELRLAQDIAMCIQAPNE